MTTLQFDWDQHNVDHIALHDVSPEQAEQALLSDTIEVRYEITAKGEERWSHLGQTNRGRILFLVFTLRGERMRVVTAFDAEKRDKLFYSKMKAGQNA